MIVWLLSLFVTNAYGAAIPSQPVIPTTSTCLQGCFESGSVVNAAFDLLNFRSIAIDIENFCSINGALLKCGRACPPERLPELDARTHASSYICSDKIEEFRLVSHCLGGAEDVTPKCAMECGVPTVVPLRLDSSSSASVNPTVFLDGIAGICRKQVCLVRCTQDSFNKECAGAGDLFMDLAKHQVRRGIDNLIKDSNNDNQTTVRLMTENYMKNLPSDCGFLKDIDEFEKVFTNNVPKDSESSTMLPAGIVPAIERSESKDPSEAEAEAESETEAEPETEAEEGTTGALVEGEGFVMESGDVTAVSGTMPTPSPTINVDKEELEEEETEPSSVITEEVAMDVNNDNKTDIVMDVNAVMGMSSTPSEPVIVVDNASNDIGDNSIQAELKEEVKSSSTSVIVSLTLFITVAGLLFV